MNQRCDSCKFWRANGQPDSMGECRKHAPRATFIPIAGGRMQLIGYWPPSHATGYCAEWSQGILLAGTIPSPSPRES